MTKAQLNFAWLALFLLISCGLIFVAEPLEYSRQAILTGQVWRIWSGHFVHTNLSHLALNLVSFAALYYLLFLQDNLLVLLLVSFLSCLLISISLLLFAPHIDWYNGLSGLLHSLTVYYAARKAIVSKNWLYWSVVALVLVKVSTEMVARFNGKESQMFSMNVIVEAHLIGFIVGLALSLFMFILLPKFRANCR